MLACLLDSWILCWQCFKAAVRHLKCLLVSDASLREFVGDEQFYTLSCHGMQCASEGLDMRALLNGIQPEQYAAMLTAENAKEVLGLVDVGGNATLMDAKAVMAGAVNTLLHAENKLHSSVTATAAAATVIVSI